MREHIAKCLKILDVTRPIIQAPMAGSDGEELVAAVSNHGGLGSLGAGYLQPGEILKAIRAIKKLTKKPYAINLFIPTAHTANDMQINIARSYIQAACHELNFELPSIKPPYVPDFNEQFEVLIAEKVPVFSFTFGMPSPEIIDRAKQNGMCLIGTATNISEAQILAEHGIDMVVAQGVEAGGHRGTFMGAAEDSLIGLNALLPSMVAKVKIPVIAAGGIMNGKGIISAFALGASAVQMGTAFLTTPESKAIELFKTFLLKQTQDKTVLTRAFTGKLARGIKNFFIEEMIDNEDAILNYPIQHALTFDMRQAAKNQGNLEYMSLWAGQAACLSRGMAVKDFMQQLDQELETSLANLADAVI